MAGTEGVSGMEAAGRVAWRSVGLGVSGNMAGVSWGLRPGVWT